MDNLHPPDRPIAILPNTTTTESTEILTVKQLDDSSTGRDYTISDAAGNTLFTVAGRRDGKSFQRNFRDASKDETLFELRRSAASTTNAWFIETPDPNRQTVLTGDLKFSWAHVKVDVVMKNAASASGEEEVKLEVRGQDARYIETDVLFQGQRIVKVRKITGSTMPVIPFLNSNRTGSRDAWEVHIAKGVDRALASALAVILSDFRRADSCQAAVTAIRKARATKNKILLLGTDSASAGSLLYEGSAEALSKMENLDGTTTNLIFEVHKYLDFYESGTHSTCSRNNVEVFQNLGYWLREQKRQAILAETGGGAFDTSCRKLLCQ